MSVSAGQSAYAPCGFRGKVARSAPEDRERITVLGCGNAAGQYVPGFFLLPHDLKDASGKIYVEASGNGWNDEQKFHHWLEFVLFPFLKPLLETG